MLFYRIFSPINFFQFDIYIQFMSEKPCVCFFDFIGMSILTFSLMITGSWTSFVCRVICAYQGNFLLQDVLAGEHAEADFSSSGSGNDEDTDNNESVHDPVIARLDSVSMCMHPNFTLCRESPITVGRCFMEVCIFSTSNSRSEYMHRIILSAFFMTCTCTFLSRRQEWLKD